MTDDEHVIPKGRFKGKKVVFALTERIEEFRHVRDEFMEEIFDLARGNHLVSDESDFDFTDMGSSDATEIWTRIRKTYGLERTDVESERLVTIFAAILRGTQLQ